jgi:FeS assembly SUF system regulator
MIRITKQADYGIVLMTHLSRNPDKLHTAPELASQTQLPLPIVSKVLKLLGRAELLNAHRGVKGGYTLARIPKAISVAEVIQAVEGPIALTECVEGSLSECSMESFCPLQDPWQLINQAVHQALSSITLAQMVGSSSHLRPSTSPTIAGTSLHLVS